MCCKGVFSENVILVGKNAERESVWIRKRSVQGKQLHDLNVKRAKTKKDYERNLFTGKLQNFGNALELCGSTSLAT